MHDLQEVFSPLPNFGDFLELLSQNTEFDINANPYRPDCLLLRILKYSFYLFKKTNFLLAKS